VENKIFVSAEHAVLLACFQDVKSSAKKRAT